MKLRLLLPPILLICIFNVLRAAHSIYTHSINVFTGFIIFASAFYGAMTLFIKTPSVFPSSFVWQHAPQNINGALICSVDNVVKLKV